MASARIHRQSCESARLPPVCICCGSQATQRVRNEFNCEPTWQIVFLPVILLLMLVVGVFTGLKLKRLYNPLAPDPISFPVPLCDAHRGRLSWHRYFLWGLIALLLAALAVLLPLSLSIAAAQGQDISGRMQLMEAALIAFLVMGGLLLLASMAIKLMTPRVVHYTTTYVDMACLAPEFVEMLRRTSTSTVAGYGQPMGAPLTAGMRGAGPSMKSMAIVGGATLVLVSGCVLFPMLVQWNSKQNLARRRAERQQRQAQKQAAIGPGAQTPPLNAAAKAPFKAVNSGPPSLPPPLPPPLSPTAPIASSEPAVAAKGNPSAPADDPAVTTRGSDRLERFRPSGTDRYPPNSRAIRDASELKPGMEVWARSGLTWYRSTITRVENPVMARVRFPAGAGKPEVPVSPLQIRLPAD